MSRNKKASLCIFCMRSHAGRGRKPALCQAKGDIARAYLQAGTPYWRFVMAVRNGEVNLEAEALLLVRRRREAA